MYTYIYLLKLKCRIVGPNSKCLLMTSLKLQIKGFSLFLRDEKSYSIHFSGRIVKSHFRSYSFHTDAIWLASLAGSPKKTIKILFSRVGVS